MATALAFVDGLPSARRYRAKLAFSNNRSMGASSQVEPRYIIMHESRLLLNGRTFSRDDAEAICDALEEAAQAGFEEAVEG